MIINGNNIEELKKFDDNYFDSIVTDPPYEIGFMGKSWDASGIANNPEMWSECLRVLKPGGYLLSFSATRTYHRMAVAIEDSGFEIRDMIAWVYGSGFPKSLNIGKAVDKLQGNEREEYLADIAYPDSDCWGTPNNNITSKGVFAGDIYGDGIKESVKGGKIKRDKGTSEWEGWGTALKPAHEPICMARKPLAEKTVAENCLKYGTGGINIDESRVGNERVKQLTDVKAMQKFKEQDGREHKEVENRPVSYKQGRFPANLIHDNSEEVRECFPETKSTPRTATVGGTGGVGVSTNFQRGSETSNFNDSGNASRFFKSIIYQAKASKSERNKGCEGLEEKERESQNVYFKCKNCNNWIDKTPSQSRKHQRPNSTCQCEIPNEESVVKKSSNQNNHPTVKPVALMEYLIKMVTPTNGIVLDPFMGSGSTGVACVLNDFEFVGIDLDKDYCEIARARIEGVKETQTKLF
jgi:DNA modification methylase